MKIERLFHVLVVSGAAATSGLVGCSDDPSTDGSGGATSGGKAGASGSAGTAGAGKGGAAGSSGGGSGGTSGGSGGKAGGGSGGTAGGGSGGTAGGGSGGTAGGGSGGGGTGGGASCECAPSEANEDWTDCNGCCCWIDEADDGMPFPSPSTGLEICGTEPCCIGNGRTE